MKLRLTKPISKERKLKFGKPPRHKLHFINNLVETQESYFFSIQNLGIIPPINSPLKHNGVPMQFFI